MKQQLKLFRQQVAKHDAEMDRLQSKLRAEEKKVIKTHVASASKLQARHEAKLAKLKKQQLTEISSAEKAISEEKKKESGLNEDRQRYVL